MDLNYGINGEISSKAANPIIVNSTTAIGIVATVDKGDVGFKKFNNAQEGLDYIEDNTITGGNLKAVLKGINLQGVNCPIVVFLIIPVDEATDKANVLDGINEFKNSDTVTGINLRNGVIISPFFSQDVEVAMKLDSIAKQLWATAITDNFSKTEAERNDYITNFGTRFVLIGSGLYKADGEKIPFSALVAGHIAFWDSKAFGWSKSHSNRVVRGVSGIEHEETSEIIEYLESSDCEARRLRQKGMATILKDEGWRLYGFETTDIEVVWQSLERVRTFHRLLTAIMKASKFARDREASELIKVKQAVADFMRELKGAGVVLGFNAIFDPLKNTNATVTAGKFYLTITVGTMATVRELNIELVYSDEWNEVLINYINGGE